MRFEQWWHSIDRADAHFVRLTTSSHDTHVATKRGEAHLFGFLRFHDHSRGGTIAELGRVARCDELTLFDVNAVFVHRVQTCEAFGGCTGAVALILAQSHFMLGDFFSLFIHHHHF